MAIAAGFFAQQASAQVRFLDPVFADVTKSANIMYDSNISVNIMYGQVPGIPIAPLYVHKLFCDVYQPVGDTMSMRPLVILASTGSYLPALANKQATGNKNDSSIVELARQFAKRGYVVAAIDYRLGWNPLTTDQKSATEQLLKATYRAMQDVRNAVRFFRVNAGTYKVDTSRIVLGGQGTGGYISYAVGTVSNRADIESNMKFQRDFGVPMVNMDTLGDWTGVGGTTSPVVFNLSGDPSVSSNLHMVFNWGGAMGDTAWMKPSSLPVVSLQNTKDALAPYYTGNVLVPVTGKTVIPNASGAGHVIPRANAMGVNNKLNSIGYNDAVSARALAVTPGVNNLFGFDGISPLDNAPWEFWNRTLIQNTPAIPYQGAPTSAPYPIPGYMPVNGREADSLSNFTNPTMTAAKGKAYCDTIARFVAPRIAVQFNITGPATLNPFNFIAPANGSTFSDVDSTDNLLTTVRWQFSHVPQAAPGSTMYTVEVATDAAFSNILVSDFDYDMDSVEVTHSMMYDLLTQVGAGSKTFYIRVKASNPAYFLYSDARSFTATKKGVGMEQINLNAFLSVFPNPAKDAVKVSMDLSKSPISTITLIDVTGREVRTVEGINANETSLNLSGLQSGMYFLNVKTMNGAAATKAIVVQ